MKQILVKVDDRVYEQLVKQVQFRAFIEGCCAGPSDLERCMIALVTKLMDGKDVLELAVKGEPLQ